MVFQFVSPSLEFELINLSLKSSENMEKSLMKLKVKDFGSDIAKTFFYEITNHYKKFNTIISKTELEQKIKDSFENKELAIEWLNKVFEEQVISSQDSLISTIKQKKRARDYAEAVRKLSTLTSEGKVEECDVLMHKFLEENYDTELFQEMALAKSTEKLLDKVLEERNNPKKFDGIPTGFIGIDAVIRGLKKQELLLWVGKTGGYKSTVMINCAGNSLLMGKKVAFFVIESSPEQYAYNLQSYLSGVPSEHLQVANVSDAEIAIVYNTMEKVKKLGGEIIFVDAPQNLTPSNLQMKIRELKRKYGVIDLVVVDYLQIMQDESGKKIDPYDWKGIATISKQLKSVARAEDVPIMTAAQKTKQKIQPNSKQTETHGVEDIAYAKGIADNCDCCIEICQTDEDKIMNVAKFYFLKTRRSCSTKNEGVPFTTNMTCQILDRMSTEKLKAETLMKV